MTVSPLAVFPLGTVLVPTGLLPLQIFETRYRALMLDLTGAEVGAPLIDEFGVVLIERGSEVGGGEQRSRTGTRARLLDGHQLPDGRWFVRAVGTHRFRVVEWLPDDPYPMALTEDLPDEEWGDAAAAALEVARDAVSRLFELARSFGAPNLETELELSDDPAVAAWQLCALTPLGPLDRQRLIEATDPAVRLTELARRAAEAGEVLAFRHGPG